MGYPATEKEGYAAGCHFLMFQDEKKDRGRGRVQGQSPGRNEILLAPHFIATITLPPLWEGKRERRRS